MGVHVESRDEPFGLHLQVKDPDGIAIEFFPAAQG